MINADNLRAPLNVAQVVADPDGPVAPIAIHLGIFIESKAAQFIARAETSM